MSLKSSILEAARADSIPAGESGLWTVLKRSYATNGIGRKDGRLIEIPAGTYTWLYRYTNAQAMHPPGEVVMVDSPDELSTHLEFMLRASGNVLVTGLGLGCVTRGLMANPAVKSVTVIEISHDVLKLVAPHMRKDPRLSIIQGDATQFVKLVEKGRFDCAWHDLWTDDEAGEPHLQVVHMGMICDLHGQVNFQGAWAFPRYFRRDMRRWAGVL